MLIKTTNLRNLKAPYQKARANYLRNFGRDEDGGLIILNLILFTIILAIGGMAVDFMRFEARRTSLQSVSDRAVLAAANLNQDSDPREVLEDYFKKAGFDGGIVGEPEIVEQGGTRSVSLQAQSDINTFYLKLLGINELAAPAVSSAIEGTGNVEISLVLDISGSMNNTVPGTGKNRMQLIREAAEEFIDELIVPEYEDQISISLVTYSSQVALSRDLFDALNVNRTDIQDATIPWTSTRFDEDHEDYNPYLAQVLGPNGEEEVTFWNPATCVELPAVAYTSTDFDTDAGYNQIETFQHRTYRTGHSDRDPNKAGLDQPNCPNSSFEKMIPISQDSNELVGAIRQLQPRQFTSIYAGMKWGVTMLDPSMRNIMSTLPSMDPAFAGERPHDYTAASGDLSTQKYIIIMTDGENVSGRRIRDTAYDTVAEQDRWYQGNFTYAARNRLTDWGFVWPWLRSHWSVTRANWSAADGNVRLQEICKASREQGITIFAIAMAAPAGGEAQMRQCATAEFGARPAQTQGFYFENDGGQIDLIFQNIAKQITDLRLSL